MWTNWYLAIKPTIITSLQASNWFWRRDYISPVTGRACICEWSDW